MLDELREKIERYIPKADISEMVPVDIYSVAEWIYSESGDLKSEEQYPISLPPWPKAWYEFRWPESTKDKEAALTCVNRKQSRVGIYQQCIEVPEVMRERWPNIDLVDALVARRELGDDYTPSEDLTGSDAAPSYVLVTTVFVSLAEDRGRVSAPKEVEFNQEEYRAKILREKGWDCITEERHKELIAEHRKELDDAKRECDEELEYLRFHPWYTHVRMLDAAGVIIEPGRSLDIVRSKIKSHEQPALRIFLPPVALAVSLMHCKNVSIVDDPVPPKVAAKRIRNGKHPGTTFKTLEIDAMRRQVRREKGDDESEMKRAFHICRGHFSTYTKEKPLFGRVTGTFWIPAHTRGSRAYGEVVKTYKVKQP